MTFELVEAYADMKIKILKLEESIYKLDTEIDNLNGELSESYRVEEIAPLFNIYDEDSIWIKDEYKEKVVNWLKGLGDIPAILKDK